MFAFEGCLSVDGWQSIVPRHRAVRFTATELVPHGDSLTERPVDLEWSGWPARILQHESDHLDGTLCHDLAVPRSVIANRYVPYYDALPDAVRRLGLTGDVTRLRGDQVVLSDADGDGAEPTGRTGASRR